MDDQYVDKMLEESDLLTCRSATTPGNDTLRKKVEEEELLSPEEHKQYRKLVGQLLWLSPVRPDITYAVKELSRSVQSPTCEHQAKLRHLLRYLSGARDQCIELRPNLMLNEKKTSLNVIVY